MSFKDKYTCTDEVGKKKITIEAYLQAELLENLANIIFAAVKK